MDGQRFDAWTRALASRLPRRGAVKLLVGVGAAGATTRTVIQDAEACLEDGQFCTTNDECCNVCIAFGCSPCLGKGHGTCDGPHDCCGGKMDCIDGICKKKKKDVKCDGKSCKKNGRKRRHHSA